MSNFYYISTRLTAIKQQCYPAVKRVVDVKSPSSVYFVYYKSLYNTYFARGAKWGEILCENIVDIIEDSVRKDFWSMKWYIINMKYCIFCLLL